MFASNGTYMCTFTNGKLSVCGIASDAGWITQQQQFRGKMPVNAMQGFAETVVVADGNGALWHCGLPTGVWEPFVPSLRGRSCKQFLGTRYDAENDVVYLVVLDTAGEAWIIGNPGQGGQWERHPNLIPPGNGPFGVNLTGLMGTFTGATLQICGVDVTARWINAATNQFPSTAPVRAMYGLGETVVVADGNGALWHCRLPSGLWGQDIPQLPKPFKEFMGVGYDIGNHGEYLAALDTAGTGWLIGAPGGGGHWVDPPNLTPPKGMAITVKDFEQLHELAFGVMEGADHHAGKVKPAVLAILGGIIWRAEPGSIRILQYAGNPASMVWARIGGKQYVFRYENGTEQIEILDDSHNGPVLHRFDGATPVADIEAAFRAL
jgi:hypothetical protein